MNDSQLHINLPRIMPLKAETELASSEVPRGCQPATEMPGGELLRPVATAIASCRRADLGAVRLSVTPVRSWQSGLGCARI